MNGGEPELSVAIGAELSALREPLQVVVAVRVRLPDVEDRTGERLARATNDRTDEHDAPDT